MTEQVVTKKIITLLTSIWGVFLVPSILMTILLLKGHVSFSDQQLLSTQILRINLIIYPFVLLLSSGLSWFFFKRTYFKTSIAWSLVPFISILLELVIADVMLFFA